VDKPSDRLKMGNKNKLTTQEHNSIFMQVRFTKTPKGMTRSEYYRLLKHNKLNEKSNKNTKMREFQEFINKSNQINSAPFKKLNINNRRTFDFENNYSPENFSLNTTFKSLFTKRRFKFKNTIYDDICNYRNPMIISNIANTASKLFLYAFKNKLTYKQKNAFRGFLRLAIAESISYTLREPLDILEKVKVFYKIGKIIYKFYILVDKRNNLIKIEDGYEIANDTDFYDYIRFLELNNNSINQFESQKYESKLIKPIEEVDFLDELSEDKLKYVTVVCSLNNKWIFLRNDNCSNYSLPFAIVNDNENINDCVNRIVFESIGITNYKSKKMICYYSYKHNNKLNYGALFYVDMNDSNQHKVSVYELSDLPLNLKHATLQSKLFQKVNSIVSDL
jgi:hypothetical protein